MADEYVQMHLRVTHQTRRRWAVFAAQQGVTASALAEAIGEWMANPNGLSLSTILERATAVTDERKSRRPARSGQGSGQITGDDDV